MHKTCTFLFSLDTHKYTYIYYTYNALCSSKNVIIVIVIVILSQWFSFVFVVVGRWIKSEKIPPIWFDGNELFICLFCMLNYLIYYVCVSVIGHFVNNVLEVREIVVWFYFISSYFYFWNTDVEMVCIARPPCLC